MVGREMRVSAVGQDGNSGTVNNQVQSNTQTATTSNMGVVGQSNSQGQTFNQNTDPAPAPSPCYIAPRYRLIYYLTRNEIGTCCVPLASSLGGCGPPHHPQPTAPLSSPGPILHCAVQYCTVLYCRGSAVSATVQYSTVPYYAYTDRALTIQTPVLFWVCLHR